MIIPDSILFSQVHDKILDDNDITLRIARFDKVHPIVSGNKLYKLHEFLTLATGNMPKKMVVTYGGAYSNHLVATAFACKQLGISCEGIVRGEAPINWSATLLECKNLGMKLNFIPREVFKHIKNEYALHDHTLKIPEGGYHPLGAKGAAKMMSYLPMQNFTHIISATGTATTLAGLILGNNHNAQIISVPVLKGMTDIAERLSYLIPNSPFSPPEIWPDFHFGGYAKTDQTLFAFMNWLYAISGVPTDIVYTGKMMFAIFEKIKAGYFAPGSNICAIHSGGLQGNRSVAHGVLTF